MRCADHSFGLIAIFAAGLIMRDGALVVLSLSPLYAVPTTIWLFWLLNLNSSPARSRTCHRNERATSDQVKCYALHERPQCESRGAASSWPTNGMSVLVTSRRAPTISNFVPSLPAHCCSRMRRRASVLAGFCRCIAAAPSGDAPPAQRSGH